MATVGYSSTPLLKKLGIKPGMKVLLIQTPGNYFDLLEANITDQFIEEGEKPDFIHLFVEWKKELLTEMKNLKKLLKPTTIIWVSWYKKAAKIETDITEDTIRNYALQNNLVDVKVCAVSELWSGLKLVIPVNKR